ncbi:MAG: hypothetical protein WCK14_05005 [Actinomycetota bacterium]
MKFFFGPLVMLGLGAGVAGCASEASPSSSSALTQADWPRELRLIAGAHHAPANDLFEVFMCDVPLTTSDPIYGRLTQRLKLTPDDLVKRLNDNVTPYFVALSHNLYHPRFVAGRTLSMSATETHDSCVERAIDSSAPATAAVMVVATAEHLPDQAGGWGRQGAPCNVDFCAASQTRRALYVGASDFHSSWGAVPAVDLTEHEIGHTLGLPHSGDPHSADEHASGIDLMSNSASPRDVNPQLRNGPDTLAINRLALGWLTADDVVVTAPAGGAFTLWPSTGDNGVRLLAIGLTDNSFLSIEYLTADGFNDFLPASGVAVHLIEGSDRVSERTQTTLGSVAPHLKLLSKAGSSLDLHGWTITVGALGSTVQVEVRPTHR